MKQNLTASQSQQLSLTPQLRQALAILQMSAQELETEIADALESNPLLERLDEGGPALEDSSPASAEPSAAEASDADWDGNTQDDWGESAEEWENHNAPGAAPDDDDSPIERQVAEESLREHLLWQLRLSPLGPRDLAIGIALIDAIDTDGYLREPLDAIASALAPDYRLGVADIEPVLHLVQRFDPPGCGSRTLGECLHLQLSLLPDDTPQRDLAKTICQQAIERLPKIGAEGVARELGVSLEDAHAAIALLRSLDPKPGTQVGGISHDEYVLPDAIIWRQKGLWKAALTEQAKPRIGINREYARMAAELAGSDGQYLKGRLQEARWLLKNIEQRGDTLLRVVQCLIREQSAFLEFGPQALRPLTLREIAQQLGLHESTISRAIARKYVRTPSGTIALRDFFSFGIDNDGMAASSTAIQSMIRELIEAENPRKPLSDAALVKLLEARGIPVARRTVAKYREALHIPASTERLRL